MSEFEDLSFEGEPEFEVWLLAGDGSEECDRESASLDFLAD